MKKLPTAPMVPRISFSVCVTIAPPPDAISPALGRLRCCAVAGGSVVELGLPRSRKLVSTPWLSRKLLTLMICDLMVLLSSADCRAMVLPPSTTTPANIPESSRQTSTSRKPCADLDDAAEQVGDRTEEHAEQDAGENQEQRRGKIPGEPQQRRKGDRTDAADRDRPGQIVARLNARLIGSCHAASSPIVDSPVVFRQTGSRASLRVQGLNPAFR